MRLAPVCVCVSFVCFKANSNKSGGLWITSSSDNYFSSSQFKVSLKTQINSERVSEWKCCFKCSVVVFYWFSNIVFFGENCSRLLQLLYANVCVCVCVFFEFVAFSNSSGKWMRPDAWSLFNRQCVCMCVCSAFSSAPRLKPLILG